MGNVCHALCRWMPWCNSEDIFWLIERMNTLFKCRMENINRELFSFPHLETVRAFIFFIGGTVTVFN